MVQHEVKVQKEKHAKKQQASMEDWFAHDR